MIEHRAFFGDSEKTFAFPTRELIEELERKTGYGVGALFRRFRTSDYSLSDVLQVIRIGLVGGGTTPAEADQLVSVYGVGRPLGEVFAVADGVITALFFGTAEDEPEDDFDLPQDEKRQAAASGDLAAAISAAYEVAPE
ncbi:gene transfer agent family protein [Sinorhizobium meliloti]|uniref:gene transfer agent family protein n=1 Tax=Rhizobium meliloti TaxID=382 RepID=UPI000FD8FCCB|nr:gene transfer agent family protein [Sinorhizobium meliloti]RVG96010.1 gene transfer agent family protein [Sinorhizobium meliloti]WQP07798.1 gene transfer agent family protein [Sinorhizobium meliloti]WQP21203.1 gene transfer agent family protein [Sinorhizobium meliloti]WQP34618.1 gene transfer agent family protein [Sinorhizobium meliloti]